MIDAAYLPGLATHLVSRTLETRGGGELKVFACGVTGVPEDRQTEDVLKVNCLRCRKTRVYKAAKIITDAFMAE